MSLKIKFISLLLLTVCAGQFGVAEKSFNPGERVVFFGDSITHYGKWWPYVWCRYVDQFPENPPLFFNAGFSGDTAAGALSRLDRDVFSKHPDTVCVMFGMNDVRRTAYTVANTAKDQADQKKALEIYQDSMDQLLKRITDKGLQCIVVTPSPYDQTMVNPAASPVLPGCNNGLAMAAQIARQLAQKYKCEVVDFHGPMTRMNAEKQAKDPSVTIIGSDRVHPTDEGSKIMAKLFLETQGIDPSGLEQTDRFPNIWEHVSVERDLRNIVWLEDRVLKPNHIDPENVAAAKKFFKESYRPQGADASRIASYYKWRGKEDELYGMLKDIENRLSRAK
ncbi:MAG: SGNH/GDSL hydrolase family protein [Kiritimatiellales bacterium]